VFRRRLAPHPFPQRLGFSFGTFELVETSERQSCGHARQAFADEHGVCADAVFAQDVRQMPAVGVQPIALDLQTNPAVQDQVNEPVARRVRKRRRGIEAAPYLRRVDAKQSDASECRDVDRVSVKDRAYQHGI